MFSSPPSSPVVQGSWSPSSQSPSDSRSFCGSALPFCFTFFSFSMTDPSSHAASRMSHTASCTPMIEVFWFPQRLNKKAAACKISRPELERIFSCAAAQTRNDDKRLQPLCSFNTRIAELLPCFLLGAASSLNSHLLQTALLPPPVARFLPSPPRLSLLSVIPLSSSRMPALLLLLNQSCRFAALLLSSCLYLSVIASFCAAAFSWRLKAMLALLAMLALAGRGSL